MLVIVEVTRLLVTLTVTAVGLRIGSSIVEWFPSVSTDQDLTTIIGAVVGTGVGYVLGGVLGRTIRTGLRRAPQLFAKSSGPELFAGAFGLVAGVVVGVVAAVPVVSLLPPLVGWPLGTLTVVVAAAFGGRVFAARAHDLLSAAGLRTRDPLRPVSVHDASVEDDQPRFLIDSSAAIDGRILELARSGLTQGKVWVAGFVIDELQSIADSSDRNRRKRGRRGLDVLDALRDVPGIEFAILDDAVPEQHEVDAKLLTVASRVGARLVTTDHNLARAAELRDITVVNPHALGESLRPTVVSGEQIVLTVERAGSEPGQGVGYLEDGTMVVVEDGASRIGEVVRAEVSNSLRTSIGRLLFARIEQ